MLYRCLRALGCVALLSVTGCGVSTVGGGRGMEARGADAPPTPRSITKEHPGGDAADPERAALDRLLAEPRSHKQDRFNTLKVGLFDWRNWQRVRIWAAPSRAAFQFGDERYAFDVTWYVKAEGSSEPEACLAWFERKAQPIADGYGVRIADTRIIHGHQEVRGERRPMVVKELEGSVDSLVASDEYVGALVAYQSWPGTCLVRGFAVVATNHRDLALLVRQRFVNEAAPFLAWNPELHQAPAFESR